jgi:hypothetical protein
MLILLLSIDCLELKTDHMSSKLLHIEYAAIYMYIRHMQVKLEYYIYTIIRDVIIN